MAVGITHPARLSNDSSVEPYISSPNFDLPDYLDMATEEFRISEFERLIDESKFREGGNFDDVVALYKNVDEVQCMRLLQVWANIFKQYRFMRFFFNPKARGVEFRRIGTVRSVVMKWLQQSFGKMIQERVVHKAHFLPQGMEYDGTWERHEELLNIVGSTNCSQSVPKGEQFWLYKEPCCGQFFPYISFAARRLLTDMSADLRNFSEPYKKSWLCPDYAIRDHDKHMPNLAVVFGTYKEYARNETGTALIDRADMLLLGSNRNVHAVIVVVINQILGNRKFRKRYKGFAELWRRRNGTRIWLDGPRVVSIYLASSRYNIRY